MILSSEPLNGRINHLVTSHDQQSPLSQLTSGNIKRTTQVVYVLTLPFLEVYKPCFMAQPEFKRDLLPGVGQATVPCQQSSVAPEDLTYWVQT